MFRVRGDRLELTDVAKTGDGSRGRRFPNSVTQHGDLVYVLNSADDGSITGFRLTGAGKLVPLPGSTRGLDANQDRFAPDALYNPAQVSFTPDGDQLVVSIKDGPAAGPLVPGVEPTGPGRILVFGVGRDGRPSTQFTRTDLANRGPFGFSFDRRGNLLVALFVGGGVENGAITGAAGLLPDRARRPADADHGRLAPTTSSTRAGSSTTAATRSARTTRRGRSRAGASGATAS